MLLTSLLVLAALPHHVYVQDVKGLDVTEAERGWTQEKLVEAMTAHGFSVVTTAQVTAVLGIERQRQLVGDPSSVSQFGAQLGVDAMVTPIVARVEDGTLDLTVKFFSVTTGEVLATHSARAASRKDVLDAWTQTLDAVDPAPPPAGYRPPLGVLVPGLVVADGGGALLAAAWGVAGGLDGVAKNASGNPVAALMSQASLGNTLQLVGVIALGVGGAMVATSLVLGAVLKTNATVTVVPTGQGAAVSFGGTF